MISSGIMYDIRDVTEKGKFVGCIYTQLKLKQFLLQLKTDYCGKQHKSQTFNQC